MNLRSNVLALALITACVPQGWALTPGPAEGAPPVLDRVIVQKTVEALATRVEADYFDPVVGGRVASRLREFLAQGRYAQIPTPEALAAQVTADMAAVARDRHLSLGVAQAPSNAQAQKGETRETRGARARRENFGFTKAEILPGNVGYLRVTAFYRPEETGTVLADAMA